MVADLAQYESSLRSLGIKMNPERWQRVSTLVRGWDPRICFQHTADLSKFGLIWKSFLDSPKPQGLVDNEDKLIVLGCILYLLENKKEKIAQALESVGLKVPFTHREALLRSTGCLYYVALSRLAKNDDEAGRQALIRLLQFTSQIDITTLKPSSQKIVFGQRGVALLALARRDDEETAKSRLLIAVEDLEASRRLGDISKEHFQKEIEVLTRLYTLTKDVRYLRKALPLAEDLAQRQQHTSEFAPEIGLAHSLHGSHLNSEGSHEESLAEYNKAVGFLQLTLNRLTGSQRSEPHYIALATSQLKRWTLYHKLGRPEDETELDEILTNFERAGSLATDQSNHYGTALFLKASRLKQRGLLDLAIELIDRAIRIPLSPKPTEEELEIRRSLNIFKAECFIWLAHRDGDKKKARESLAQLLDSAKPGEGSVAAISHAVRDLHDPFNTAPVDQLLEKGLIAIEQAATSGKHSGDAARFASSNAGTICLLLYGLENLSVLERAHKWFLTALEASESEPTLELLSWLATTSSNIGRCKLREGKRADCLSFLEDAKDYYLSVIKGAESDPANLLDLSVLHSKLAVLLLRLHTLTSDLTHAKAADVHMNRAIALGGEFPERYGYLGDAQYRIGRATRDPEALRTAVRHKRFARNLAKGKVSRENPSVTAAALLRLWRETRDVKDISEAADEISLAKKIDASWPWPDFQLAEILEEAGDDWVQKDGKSHLSIDALQTLESVGFDPGKARLQGCSLAVRTVEFKKKGLGGRLTNQVHVLDDSHGLLRETVVFKIDRLNVATRETRLIADLDRILSVTHAPSRFLHTVPIGVVSDQYGQRWYATQFQHGCDLGRVIYEVMQHGAQPVYRYDQLLSDAIHFLALFHVSAGILPSRDTRGRRSLKRFWTYDIRAIDQTSHSGRSLLSNTLQKVLSQELPLCLKKDAHPENWLVTANGNIVMVDFESTLWLPIIYEVAQLLEDYPAIPIDTDGWERRKELVTLYIDKLAAHTPGGLAGMSINREELDKTYAVFAYIRAVLGLYRLSLPCDVVIASSTSRLRNFRKKHYETLVAAFESGWGTTTFAPFLKELRASGQMVKFQG